MRLFDNVGKRIFFVGGCVRDALLGIEVTDIDLATEALPAETLALARAAGIPTHEFGVRFGTVVLYTGGMRLDITTFRSDVETDGRFAKVAFRTAMVEDAKRRDLTINALYADSEGKVFDPTGQGIDDLRAGVVRFIGRPEERIHEDFLRILRFFRFFAWYGREDHTIDSRGLDACRLHVSGVDQLTPERVTTEVIKLLSAKNPAPAVSAMHETGLLERLLPGAVCNPLRALVRIENRLGLNPLWPLRLAAILDSSPDVMSGCALRLSRKDREFVVRVSRISHNPDPPAHVAYRYGKQVATAALILSELRNGRQFGARHVAEIEKGASARFPVNAADLQPRLSGKQLGDRLKRLETRWINSDFLLTKNELLC